jgi:gamma-glutamylputrescine oxidase
VVIGGGLTGTTAAYVLAKGGLDVVLIEADRLASAGTAAALGCLVPEPLPDYRPVEAALGLRRARGAWETTRESGLDLAAAFRRLNIRCDLSPTPLLTTVFKADQLETLRRDLAARKAAGLGASWLTGRAAAQAIAPEAAGAIKQPDAFLFDPVRAALGMARAAEAAGARIFERSAARRTTFTRKSAEVVHAAGRIRTRGVYVATATPGPLFRSLTRHVRRTEGYAVVTEPLAPHMRRDTGRRDAVMVEPGSSPRWLRWLGDGRALFAGAASSPPSSRLAAKVLVQRTGQLMYELSLRHPVLSGLPARWGWSVPLVSAPDGLPWIGAHRNYPFHFFGVALGWHGDALAWFSAKAALRHFTGETAKNDHVFEFGR